MTVNMSSWTVALQLSYHPFRSIIRIQFYYCTTPKGMVRKLKSPGPWNHIQWYQSWYPTYLLNYLHMWFFGFVSRLDENESTVSHSRVNWSGSTNTVWDLATIGLSDPSKIWGFVGSLGTPGSGSHITGLLFFANITLTILASKIIQVSIIC